MTEVNGQCRRQYGNVSNQFNECIQNCQHIGQWCARRRHNSLPIGLFVFPVVFSSTTLPDTSDLVSSTFSLSINCSTSFSVSSFALLEHHCFLSPRSHRPASAPISKCYLMMRAARFRRPLSMPRGRENGVHNLHQISKCFML